MGIERNNIYKNQKSQWYKERWIVKKQAGIIERSEIQGDPLGNDREGVSCLTFYYFYGLASWKIRDKNILMPQKFTKILEADGYTGT